MFSIFDGGPPRQIFSKRSAESREPPLWSNAQENAVFKLRLTVWRPVICGSGSANERVNDDAPQMRGATVVWSKDSSPRKTRPCSPGQRSDECDSPAFSENPVRTCCARNAGCRRVLTRFRFQTVATKFKIYSENVRARRRGPAGSLLSPHRGRVRLEDYGLVNSRRPEPPEQ